MSGSYWKGGLVGLAVCVVVGCFVFETRSRDPSDSPALQFDPPFTGLADQWILPGESRSFTVQMRNLSRNAARVDELRFSCPCATATIAGKSQLPIQLGPGDVVSVLVTVVSKSGDRGRMELTYGAVAQVGDERVNPGATAEIRLVQHLNAYPPLLSFGGIKHSSGKRKEAVNLWFPEDGEAPGTEVTVESDDPCISAILERFPVPQVSLDGGNRRMTFARVTITIDPKIAPERMKAHVLIRSGTNELRIPVLGFVEPPSVKENER